MEDNSEASFNQAVYQQQRLHELFLRIDRFSTNLLAQSSLGLHNFEIVFNDLQSILLTISSKLKKEEIENLESMKDTIASLIQRGIYRPRITCSYWGTSKRTLQLDYTSWNKVKKCLFDFRKELERMIDVHGFGNPNKEDPRQAGMKR